MMKYAIDNHELIIRDYSSVALQEGAIVFQLRNLADIEHAWTFVQRLRHMAVNDPILNKQLEEIKDILIRAELEYHPDGA